MSRVAEAGKGPADPAGSLAGHSIAVNQLCSSRDYTVEVCSLRRARLVTPAPLDTAGYARKSQLGCSAQFSKTGVGLAQFDMLGQNELRLVTVTFFGC